jgi:GDP-4-dehydro-6-deoxy-D-mannose reductase
VTGATGFVGNHLFDLLSKTEAEFFGICFPEEPEPGKYPPGFHMHKADVRSEKEIEESIKFSKPEYIIHLAAVSNVGQSWKKRKETFEVNIMGTFYLFEAVRKHASKARVLFISSSDVYGLLEPHSKPLTEKEPVRPVSPYGFTKMSGENLCRYYSKIEGLDIITARAFPHTGPGQSPDFVCSDWASQIARIEKELSPPIIKVGNIEAERDFIDVRDVVKAYFSLIKKGRRGHIYNVSSGRALSLKKVLDMLLEYSGVEIDIKKDKTKLRKVDIPVLVGDNRKIREEISWTPEVPMEQTLLDLLQYWRGVYHS